MTVPASSGVVSLAFQPGKVGKYGTFVDTDLDFYKMRVVRVGAGQVDDTQVFPIEVGSDPVPAGAYKQAHFFAGDTDIIPRLKEIFGILLMGVMGSVTSVTDRNYDGDTITGLNTHIFRFDPNDKYSLPWMAMRRMTPGRNQQNSGETGFDCRFSDLVFTIPAMGKLQVRSTIVGRDVVMDDSSAWTYANASYENDLSSPDVGNGQFLLGGVEYPIVSAQVTFTNGLSSPRDEMVIGDYRPDDFIPLARIATIRIVYKYENDDFCRKIYTGSIDGTTWTEIPFVTETDGATKGFEAYFQSANKVPSTSPETGYGLKIVANKVVWAMDGPPQLQGGGIVLVPFTGTVLLPDSGNYIDIAIENAASGSTYVPTAAIDLTTVTTKAYSTGMTVLDATATVAYNGLAVWNHGKVSISWGAATAGSLSTNDSFDISTAGNFTLVDNLVKYSGTTIGTFSGGTYRDALTVELNENATTAIVEDLVEALRYGRTTNSDSTTSFPVTIVVEDSAGNVDTSTIVITHS